MNDNPFLQRTSSVSTLRRRPTGDRASAPAQALARVGLAAVLAFAAGEARGEETEAADRAPGPEAATVAESATGEPQAERVGEVRVAAPPVIEGTRVDRYGTQVTSVGSDQIEGLNAQDVAAGLRRVPGVTISRYNAIGAFGGADGGAIFIRGHGSGRPGAEISTRIDGIPRFVGIWTHPLLDTLSVDIADRIDVYRSAQPVTFGNMSFAAIDIVPKRLVEPGVHARGIAQYGSHDTLVLRTEHGLKEGPFDYFLSASYRKSEGHREDSGGIVRDLFGRAGWEISKHWYASVFFDHTDGDVENPQKVGAPKPPRTEVFRTDNELYAFSLSHSYENLDGSLKLSFEDGSINWKQWDFTVPEPFDSNTLYRNYGIRAREAYRPWKGGEVVAGYDFEAFGGDFAQRRPSGDRSVANPHFYNMGPYALVSQSFYAFEEKLEITPSAGARYNHSRYYDDDWGAQAGLRVKRGKTEVHANYARAYNLPGPYVVVNYTTWGRGDEWKDLEPETMHHFELGVSQGIAEWLQVSVTGFYDNVSDAIRFVPPPPPPPLFANVGDYELAGGEAMVEVFPIESLKLFAGAGYLRSQPDDVPNVPEWTVSFGATWSPLRGLTLIVDGEWVDERYVLNPRYAATQTLVDDYFLLNARIAYQVHKHLQVFAGGENLADSDYEFRPGYPMPGITGYVGTEVKL
ncbi:MAG: TonB-dependent receptor [Planctomycetota bacterium]